MVRLEDDPFLLGETVTFQGLCLLNFGGVSYELRKKNLLLSIILVNRDPYSGVF